MDSDCSEEFSLPYTNTMRYKYNEENNPCSDPLRMGLI